VNAQFTAGNIVVLQFNGTTNVGTSLTVKEFTPSGAAGTTINMPSSSGSAGTVTNRCVSSGSATSEGHITISPDGFYLGFGGYDAAAGTSAVAGTASSTVPRVMYSIDNSGTILQRASTTTSFSANNFRSYCFVSTAHSYAGGNVGGVVRYGSSNNDQLIYTTQANNRALYTYNNRVYVSSASGTTSKGITVLGNSGSSYTAATNVYSGYSLSVTDAAASATATKVFDYAAGVGATNSIDPYGFYFLNDSTLYVCDNSTNGTTGGVDKYTWTKAAGAWGYKYTFGTVSGGAQTSGATGAWGITVDNSGANPVLYYTTSHAAANRIMKVTDNGVGAPNGTTQPYPVTLVTAGAGTIFKGITVSPKVNVITPTQLTLGTVNGSSVMTAGRSFTVPVTSTDASLTDANVTTATGVTLTARNTATADSSNTTISGTLTRTIAVSSFAPSPTFTGLSLPTAGVYTITATASSGMSLTSAKSKKFTVLEQASSLVFTSVPATNVIGSNLTTFTVTAKRTDGSTETTFPGSCTISRGSGSVSGALSGTLSAAFTNGVATFSAVQFDTEGTLILQANATNPTLTATSTSIAVTDGTVSYTWNGSVDNNYSTAANWTPTRTTPATTDKLNFTADANVVLDVTNQTIGQFKVTGGATVNLSRTATTTSTITINGNVGADLLVSSGSTLNITSNAATAIIRFSIGSSATGQIAGTVFLNGTGANNAAAHQLATTAASQLEVLSGGLVWVGSNFSAATFVFTSSTNDATIFRNGSRYKAQGGNYIWGITGAPNYVVMEQSSVYEIAATNTVLSFGSKNYTGVLEINTDYNFTNTFSNPCTFNVIKVATGKVVSVNYSASSTGNWTVDTLQIGANGRFLVQNANVTGSMTISKIAPGDGARIQLGSATSSISFASGLNQVKQLTWVGNNTLNIQSTILVDSLFGFAGATSTGTINTGSNVTLNSTASLTAYIPVSTGTISGGVTLRRWINGANFAAKSPRHISSPVVSTTAFDLTNGFGLSGNDLQTWNENSNASVPGSGWTAITNTGTVLSPGTGYAYSTTGNQYIDLSGTPNNGDVALSLTRNASGFNLIGNPYPQAIDWNSVITPANGFDNTKFYSAYYTWGNFATNAGSWLAHNNGFPTSRRYVSSMQAVLVAVKAPNTSATWTFKNVHRATANGQAIGRVASDSRTAVELSVNAQGSTHSDDFAVYFQDGANPVAFSGDFDARKLNTTSAAIPTVYGVISGTNYAVKGLPLATATTEMPLVVRVPATGTYEFRFNNLQNVDNYNVYLIDNVANTSTLVRQNDVVSFTMNASNTAQRFSIRFVPAAITSVQDALGTESISLYPNPATGNKLFVAVNNTATEGNVTATVVNSIGQVVAQSSNKVDAGNNQVAINLQGVASGVYLVTVVTPTQIVTRKVVVQ